jgi:hypothetical protein
VFAWQPSDIPGVPRKVIEHHLAVYPHARPVKQKVRKQVVERQEFIAEEIKKLETAGLVRGVLHPTWLANPVVVRCDLLSFLDAYSGYHPWQKKMKKRLHLSLHVAHTVLYVCPLV